LLVLVGCTSTVPTTDAGMTDAPAGPCTLPTLAQTVATLAGCSQAGTDDGVRGDSRFANPTNVVIAPGGVTYVTDFDTNRIRAVDAAGATTTVYMDEKFVAPFGLALAPGGDLYVETDDNDRGEHSLETGTLWRIDPIAHTAEVIARDLGRPRGLAVLSDGRIAMADHMHHTISILDPATGAATLLAGVRDVKGYANGVGTEAQFAQPYDIVLHPDGSLIVADMENHRLRRVFLDGTVVDFAGSGDEGALNGPVAVATFDAPQALAILPTGVVFVTDIDRKLVRRIANGSVSTVAGDGTPGWIDATVPRNARFYGLEGMDVDASRLVVADGNIGDGSAYNHVRVLQLSGL
jgi:DNA-binding beta-propeller fold protein YncE